MWHDFNKLYAFNICWPSLVSLCASKYVSSVCCNIWYILSLVSNSSWHCYMSDNRVHSNKPIVHQSFHLYTKDNELSTHFYLFTVKVHNQWRKMCFLHWNQRTCNQNTTEILPRPQCMVINHPDLQFSVKCD